MEYSVEAKVFPAGEGAMLSMNDMLAYFEKQGALRVSDLHIKIGTQPCYRIDGDLVKLKGGIVTGDIAEKLIYPLLGEKNINALKRDTAVDCSYRYGTLQFRINAFYENDGLCAAIRALGTEIPPPEKIGFPNDVWQDIVRRKHGLILFTGITGAGKSTTIASLIERINETRACRILTLEDPVEYIYSQKNSLISQREIGKDVDSFAHGLRSMMRQDPDVIFVGEMRDSETVSLTLTAAETGHLVFSTLHTRDAVGTITRILDFGKGRVVAMEVLNSNYAIANLIRKNKLEQIYSQLQVKTKNQTEEKMVTMERHLATLVKRGIVDLREAQKWANDMKCFQDAMNNDVDLEQD
jgi:twitching motility protein PilT